MTPARVSCAGRWTSRPRRRRWCCDRPDRARARAAAAVLASRAVPLLDEAEVLGREDPLRAVPAGDDPGVDHPDVVQPDLVAAAGLALLRRGLLATDDDPVLDA